MDRLRVGIIGFGGFGRFLHKCWSELDSVEIVAVSDEAQHVEAPDLALYRDWRELVRDTEVDLVSIATPPASHVEIACAALEAGKHVLVEKPLATTLKDAKRIVDAHARSGRVATVDYMLRFNPIVETLQRWAHELPFGRLRRVLVENYAQDETLPREHWFWDAEVSGGILVEHAVHFIDVVHGCTAASPSSVDGFSVTREDGRRDRMGMTVVYEDGLVMTQYHAFSRPGFFETTTMRFAFDLAEVEVSGWIPLSGRIRALVSNQAESELDRLPGFATLSRTAISDVEDASRPRGWGTASVSASAEHAAAQVIRSGGIAYEAGRLVEARFELPDDKATVYATCLRAIMSDVVAATRDPAHRLRITLYDGVKSLTLALEASRPKSL